MILSVAHGKSEAAEGIAADSVQCWHDRWRIWFYTSITVRFTRYSCS